MRLGYVIIHVPDVPAALAFAAEALIAQYGLGVRENRADAAPAAVKIGLVTDDVAAAYAKALAKGATEPITFT